MRGLTIGFEECVLRLELLLVAGTCVSGNSGGDPWVVDLRAHDGAFAASSTRQDLVRHFGAANCIDQDLDAGEGEMASGTVVFPQESRRTLEVFWKDPKTKLAPRSA